MAKDPAFLFYSKDWKTGTDEMFPIEKGVYIDLLVHQHQHGGLPLDEKRICRIVGLTMDEFKPIWEVVKHKFKQMDNQLVNQKLHKIVNDRQEYAKKLTITGVYASLIKKSNLKPSELKLIKKAFNTNDFDKYPKEELKEIITKWFNQMVIQIDNNLEDVIEDVDVNKYEEENEKEKTGLVFPFDTEEFIKWWAIWKDYRKEQKKSYKPIGEQAALRKVSKLSEGNEETAIKIIEQSIENGWIGIFELNNSNNGNTKNKQTGGSEILTTEGVLRDIRRRETESGI